MLSKREKLKRCRGCRDDFYNHQQASDGADPAEKRECWHLETATAATLEVYYSANDLERTVRPNTLSCWHSTVGYGRKVTRKAKRYGRKTPRQNAVG